MSWCVGSPRGGERLAGESACPTVQPPTTGPLRSRLARIFFRRHRQGGGPPASPTTSLLLLPLRGHRFHGGFHLFGIAQIVAVERLQIVVELVHQRHARRYVQFDD